MSIDLRDYPETLDTINGIISNNSIAEVKTERNGQRVVVVAIERTLKQSEDIGVQND